MDADQRKEEGYNDLKFLNKTPKVTTNINIWQQY
jgi:hypothetical protein